MLSPFAMSPPDRSLQKAALTSQASEFDVSKVYLFRFQFARYHWIDDQWE